MDDRVQQCPNCGAAVLPSARFCVTCGIRLPDAAPAPEAPTAPRGWARPEEDVWIGEAPALDDESEQFLSEDVPADAPATDAAPVEEAGEPAAAASEDEAGTDAIHEETVIIALPPSEQADPFATESQGLDASTGWNPGQPWAAPPDSDAPRAFEDDAGDATELTAPQPQPPHAGEEQMGPEGELAGELQPAAEDSAPSEPLSLSASGYESVQPSGDDQDELEDMDAFEPAGWTDEDDSAASGDDDGDASSHDEPTGGTSTMTTVDAFAADQRQPEIGESPEALARASALLDELRTLLPQLAAPAAAPQPAVDLAALRERALAARGDRSFDNFAALREVVADAVNRPKDIEVVLRLSQRVEDMHALIQERDRLDAAFAALIDDLQQ